jgi:acetyltransferase
LGLFASGAVPRGKRVGILTTTGGGGVWMADKCREVDLQVPEFVGQTRAALEATLPAFAAASNPADLTGQMYTDRLLFQRTVDVLVQERNIDALILVSGGNPETVGGNVLETITTAARASDKPLYVAWVGAPDSFYRQLTEAGVPSFGDPARCAQALGHVAEYARRRACLADATSRAPAPSAASAAQTLRAEAWRLAAPDGRLAEHAAKQLFETAGVPVARTRLVTDADAAVEAAEAVQYPVVLKADSAGLLHRSEIGAVALNLGSAAEVRRAFADIMARARDHVPAGQALSVSVQPMLPRGVELIVGVTRDAAFGPILMVGLGGVQAEALRDSVLSVIPVSADDARALLARLRGRVLLAGFRGSEPSDVDAAAEAIEALAGLAEALSDDLQEMEVNPLVVLPRGEGVAAADALVVLRTRDP